MKGRSAWAVLALATLLAGAMAAQARDVTDPSVPRALQGTHPVHVEWGDPAGFTELRYSRNRFEARRGDWVRRLAEHLQARAAQAIGPGERLELLITDIDLAGQYEPMGAHMHDVRVVRDIYPPRMELDFVRYGADGRIMHQGARRLADHGFLGSTPGSAADSLRFEKRMIEDWLRREFPSTPAPRGQR